MNPGDVIAIAILFFAVALAGLVAWVLWVTWMLTRPEEPVDDGHRPRTRPECWRPRGDWRSRCDAP